MATSKGGDDGSDPLLTMDVVREFMLSKGGKIQNHELVSHFRNFLNDPTRKAANRQKIKVFVNTLAVVKLDPSGEKVLTLKKKYQEGGNFGGGPIGGTVESKPAPVKAASDTKKEKKAEVKKDKKDEKNPVDGKNAKETSKSCDNLTETNVAFDNKEEDYVLVSKEETRSKSVEDLDRVKPVDPFVSPQCSQDLEISQENLVSPTIEEPVVECEIPVVVEEVKLELDKENSDPEKQMEELSVDQPDAVRKQSSSSTNECSTPKLDPVVEDPSSAGLSVKALARNLNQIESENQSLPRPLAQKNKRESRKPVQSEDGNADYVITFTELDRNWLMATANCDYMTMMKMLQSNPELARKRDFITGYAPLHWAAKHGNDSVVKMLCGHNVDVNVRTRGGYTPLHLAAMQNHYTVAELLVKVYGADTNIRDYNGKKAKQCLPNSATTLMHSLLQSRRPASIIPDSPINIPANSAIGKAMFLGMNAVGGLRISASGKENAPVAKPAVQDDSSLMPPPLELPPVARKAKPVARQKDSAHSDSETQSPIPVQSLHGCESSPNFGTEV